MPHQSKAAGMAETTTERMVMPSHIMRHRRSLAAQSTAALAMSCALSPSQIHAEAIISSTGVMALQGAQLGTQLRRPLPGKFQARGYGCFR